MVLSTMCPVNGSMGAIFIEDTTRVVTGFEITFHLMSIFLKFCNLVLIFNLEVKTRGS